MSNSPPAMEARKSFTQYGEYQGALCKVETVMQAQAAPVKMEDVI